MVATVTEEVKSCTRKKSCDNERDALKSSRAILQRLVAGELCYFIADSSKWKHTAQKESRILAEGRDADNVLFSWSH